MTYLLQIYYFCIVDKNNLKTVLVWVHVMYSFLNNKALLINFDFQILDISVSCSIEFANLNYVLHLGNLYHISLLCWRPLCH